jgi:hypothetical protein
MWKVTLAAIILLLAGCRSADWHIKKALEKGAKMDTTTRVVKDTLQIKALRDSIQKLVDPRVIYLLCQELIKADESLDPTLSWDAEVQPIKPRPGDSQATINYIDSLNNTKRRALADRGDITVVGGGTNWTIIPASKDKLIKRMQQELCPQLDSTYMVPVHAEDSIYYMPVHIKLEEGKYVLKTSGVTIGYTTEQTDVSIRSVDGYKWFHLLIAFMAGISLTSLVFIIYVLKSK